MPPPPEGGQAKKAFANYTKSLKPCRKDFTKVHCSHFVILHQKNDNDQKNYVDPVTISTKAKKIQISL